MEAIQQLHPYASFVSTLTGTVSSQTAIQWYGESEANRITFSNVYLAGLIAGLTAWADVNTVITNYTTAETHGVLETLNQESSFGSNLLGYIGLDSDDRTSFQEANAMNLFAGLTTWGNTSTQDTMAYALNAYISAKGAFLFDNLSYLTSKVAAYDWYSTDSNSTLWTTVQNYLTSGDNTWTLKLAFINKYNTVNAAGDLSNLLLLGSGYINQRALIEGYAGDANKASFANAYSAGLLSTGQTSWTATSTILANYAAANSADLFENLNSSDQGTAYAWYYDTAHAGASASTRQALWGEAYSAGILDHLSVWEGDNSLLGAITAYSVLTSAIDLSRVDNAQKGEFYQWYYSTPELNPGAPFANMNLFSQMSDKDAFNDLSGGPLTAAQKRQLVNYVASFGITPAHITEITTSNTVLASHTDFECDRLPYLKNMVKVNMADNLGGDMLDPLNGHSTFSISEKYAVVSELIKAGLSASDVQNAVPFVKQTVVSAQLNTNERAQYIRDVAVLYKGLGVNNGASGDTFAYTGLFQNLFGGTVLSDTDQTTIIHAFVPFGFEASDLASIPCADSTALASHTTVQARIDYISLALSLNLRKGLYRAYSSASGLLATSNQTAVVEALRTATPVIASQDIESIDISVSEAASVDLSNDTNSTDRVAAIRALINNPHPYSSAIEIFGALGLASGDISDCTTYFAVDAKRAAYDALNEYDAFDNLSDPGKLAAVEGIIDNFTNLSWNYRMIMLRNLQGSDIQAALSFFADNTNNQAAYVWAYSNYNNLLSGLTAWSDMQTVISNYATLAALNNGDGWVNLPTLLGDITAVDGSTSIIQQQRDALAWSVDPTTVDSTTQGAINRSGFDDTYSAHILDSLTKFALIAQPISEYVALANWGTNGATRDQLLSLLPSSADKRSALDWAVDPQHGATNRSHFAVVQPYLDSSVYTTWTQVETISQWSEVTDLLGLITVTDGSNSVDDQKTAALTWAVDTTPSGQSTQGAINRAAFDATYALGSGSGEIFSGLSTWSTVEAVLTDYSTANTAGVLATLMNGADASADRTNLAGYAALTGGNPALFQAANTAGLFASLTTWSDMDTAFTNYSSASTGLSNDSLTMANLLGSGQSATRGSDARTVLANYVTANTRANGLVDSGSVPNTQTALAEYASLAGLWTTKSDGTNYNLNVILDKVSSIEDKEAALSDLVTNSNVSGWTTTNLRSAIDEILGDQGNDGLHLFDQLSTWSDITAAIAWWGDTSNYAKFEAAYTLTIFGNLTTWSDVLTVINNVATAGNDASALISGATASDARVALANYVTAGNDATNVLALASGAANQRTMLAGYVADTNKGSFATIYSSVLSDLTSETVWATNIGAALANYVSAGSDATHVLGLASDAADKRTMLAGYVGDANNTYFAAAETAGLFTDWTSLTSWSGVSTVLANYATISGSSWSNLSTLLEDISAVDNTGQSPISIATQRRSALGWAADGTNGAAHRTAFDAAYALAGGSGEIFSGLSTWSTVEAVLTDYATIATATWTTSLGELLTFTSSAADQRSGLDWAAASSGNRSNFDAAYLLAGGNGEIFLGLSTWSTVEAVLTDYATIVTASWTGADHLPTLLNSVSSAADKRSALTWAADTTPSGQSTQGAINRAAFDATYALGSGSGEIFSGLSTWSTVEAVLTDYATIVTASWTTSLAELLGDISTADGSTSVATQQQMALAWAADSANGSTNRSNFDAANSGDLLLNLATTWSDVSAAITWWDYTTDSGATYPYQTAFSNIRTLFPAIDDATTWYVGVSGKLEIINGYAAANTAGLFAGLSSSQDELAAFAWYYDPANGSIVSNAWVNSTWSTLHSMGTGADGVFTNLSAWANKLAAIDNYNALSSWGTDGATRDSALSYTTTGSDKRDLLAYFSYDTEEHQDYYTNTPSDLLTGITTWSVLQNTIENYNYTSTNLSGGSNDLLASLSSSDLANYASAGSYANGLIDQSDDGDTRTAWANYADLNDNWNPGYLNAILNKITDGADQRMALSDLVTNANILGWTTTPIQTAIDDIFIDTTDDGFHLFDQLSTWTDITSAISWWGTSGNPAKFKAAYDLMVLDNQLTPGSVHLLDDHSNNLNITLDDLTTWSNVLAVINNVATAGNDASALISGATASDARVALANYVTASDDGVLSTLMAGTSASADRTNLAGYGALSRGDQTLFQAANTDVLFNTLTTWGDTSTSGTMAYVLHRYSTANSDHLFDNLGSSDQALAYAWYYTDSNSTLWEAVTNYIVSGDNSWGDATSGILGFITKYNTVNTAGDLANLESLAETGINAAATYANQRTLIEAYANDTTNNGYFAAVFPYLTAADDTWAEIVGFITAYNAVGSDRSNLESLAETGINAAATYANKRTLIEAYAADTTNNGYFAAVFPYLTAADDNWTAISSFITAYNTAGSDRSNLESLASGGTYANKRTLIEAYAADTTNNGYFAAVFPYLTAADDNWTAISSFITAYNTAGSDRSNLESLASGGTYANKRTLIEAYAADTTNNGYFAHAYSSGLLAGITSWGDNSTSGTISYVLHRYSTANSDNLFANLAANADNQGDAYAWYYTDSNSTLWSTIKNYIVSGDDTWAKKLALITAYNTVSGVNSGDDLADLLSLGSTAQSPTQAQHDLIEGYYADTTNNGSFATVYSAGLLTGLTSWSDIQAVIIDYLALQQRDSENTGDTYPTTYLSNLLTDLTGSDARTALRNSKIILDISNFYFKPNSQPILGSETGAAVATILANAVNVGASHLSEVLSGLTLQTDRKNILAEASAVINAGLNLTDLFSVSTGTLTSSNKRTRIANAYSLVGSYSSDLTLIGSGTLSAGDLYAAVSNMQSLISYNGTGPTYLGNIMDGLSSSNNGDGASARLALSQANAVIVYDGEPGITTTLATILGAAASGSASRNAVRNASEVIDAPPGYFDNITLITDGPTLLTALTQADALINSTNVISTSPAFNYFGDIMASTVNQSQTASDVENALNNAFSILNALTTLNNSNNSSYTFDYILSANNGLSESQVYTTLANVAATISLESSYFSDIMTNVSSSASNRRNYFAAINTADVTNSDFSLLVDSDTGMNFVNDIFWYQTPANANLFHALRLKFLDVDHANGLFDGLNQSDRKALVDNLVTDIPASSISGITSSVDWGSAGSTVADRASYIRSFFPG